MLIAVRCRPKRLPCDPSAGRELKLVTEVVVSPTEVRRC